MGVGGERTLSSRWVESHLERHTQAASVLSLLGANPKPMKEITTLWKTYTYSDVGGTPPSSVLLPSTADEK